MNNNISERDMFMLMMENAEKRQQWSQPVKKLLNIEKSLNM